MSDPELPPDLADLERRLIDRPRAESSPELGPRVLAACRTALSSPLSRASGERAGVRGRGRRAMAAAAAVLLLVNLSMSLAANTDWDLLPRAESGGVAATADRLRELAPDLPESELRRQALLARAAADLPPTVYFAPNPERLRATKESD